MLYKPSEIFDKSTKIFKGNIDKVHNSYIWQNGREVMQFVSRILPKSLDEVLKRANKNISDLKYIILHQANKRIIDYVVDKCKIDHEKVPINIEKYGNMSSATVPVLLHQLNSENKLQRGDLIALAGFGSGLAFGASLVQW
jgi:3-oxoacyl-[acyl-carrier-protein] synthase-3